MDIWPCMAHASFFSTYGNIARLHKILCEMCSITSRTRWEGDELVRYKTCMFKRKTRAKEGLYPYYGSGAKSDGMNSLYNRPEENILKELIYNDHDETFKYLIKRWNIDVNDLTFLGFSQPLEYSPPWGIILRYRRFNLLYFIHRQGFDIDEGDLIYFAASWVTLRMFKYLLAHYSHWESEKDELMKRACLGGRLSIVRYLRKCDIDACRGEYIWEALASDCSGIGCSWRTAKQLIRWGADIHYNADLALRWACGGSGMSDKRNISTIKWLLRHGADINARWDESKKIGCYNHYGKHTPLNAAIYSECLENIKYLLKRGAIFTEDMFIESAENVKVYAFIWKMHAQGYVDLTQFATTAKTPLLINILLGNVDKTRELIQPLIGASRRTLQKNHIIPRLIASLTEYIINPLPEEKVANYKSILDILSQIPLFPKLCKVAYDMCVKKNYTEMIAYFQPYILSISESNLDE